MSIDSPIPGETEGAALGAHVRADTAESFRADILDKLTYNVGKSTITASDRDWFVATALAVRDRIVDRWIASTRATYEAEGKRVYYLSLEFLIGRLLFDSISNLGLTDVVREALDGLDVSLDQLRKMEPDAALGNGGLGRLAACFMESMSTLAIPAYGYGIRYDHGLFRQAVKNGWQQEYPEDWLSFGNPWEFERPEVVYDIGFGGTVEAVATSEAMVKHVWHPADVVEAVAYDTTIVGWRGKHVNTLRLWSARASDPLILEAFNRGDHVGAFAKRMKTESISKILYPSDETPEGQELRLRQEYFFAAASLRDLLRRHLKAYGDVRSLPDKVAIQLNDTHPTIAVVELMRILVDVHELPWEEAWDIVQRTFSYTNHTLLPEALESWPVPLMERLLPRHVQLIYLMNALHLDNARRINGDGGFLASVSLIDEQHGRRVRMGNLAFLASHRVNGVSALHSDLMKQTVFRDFNALQPGKITNKTNGITFRRWLYQANPGLTRLIVDAVGPDVLDDTRKLKKLETFAGDAAFQEKFAAVKRANKIALGKIIREQLGVAVDPDALFDIQIKRIHEYKRQLLNILETIALYDAIRAQPMRDWTPRVKVFAGKAAASYHQAKLIIKLINDVAKIVNSDPTVRGKLKVVFLPNYNVSLAESIIPAADLSEQISTAGMEASGTGNMKLSLNGALTMGTLDGANVEILEHVGADNIFIFGLTAQEVEARRREGIEGRGAIAASPQLSEVIDAVASGVFSPGENERFHSLVNALRHHDYFLVTADFDSYYATQRKAGSLWRDKSQWWRSSIINVANMGWFSSDRTIGEYAGDIWHVPVKPVE